MHRASLLALAALATFCATGLAPAQAWVELVRVPDEVTGSLKDGRNLVVTARIRGADVVDVWLAVEADDSRRAPLKRSGPDLWQVNLAGGRAAGLLESHGKGSVAVHARTADGSVASSVPIRFDVPAVSGNRAMRIAQVLAVDEDGRRSRTGPEDDLWLVPEEVERIEVGVWPRDRDASVEARADASKWSLRRTDSWTAELDVDDEIASAWREAGVLTLHLGGRDQVQLHAVPRVLGLDEHLHFTVGQRETLELPGSDGRLEVSLGDITRGQVRVGVRTRDGRLVVPMRSMREYDRVRFEHRGEGYLLELDCLVNHLIGHDYAEFEIWKPSTGQ